MTEDEIERRALSIYGRLSERPSISLRERLLRREKPPVVARVEALERSDRGAAGWLSTEAIAARGEAPVPLPERVGAFRLEAKVGEGGMGQVWRAVRDDGLYEQTVAIKFIHPHLAPLAGDRFAAERRILARLEHPNIARMIDGGVTGEGIPYLIMEYVEGAAIDEAARGRSLRERISLFRNAADAVEFAHSRLVVHADLKPSNVLVGAQGWVKLLDFGIARLLGGDEEGESQKHPMTQAYASPARMGGAAPTIADDVFALGIILRELLETESDRDLCAIADKASARDEAARYASVSALSADLDRWRESLPVTAREPTLRYRAWRFVGRHRLGVAATAAALLLLSGTSVAASLSYLEAERARAEADARFADVRGTANYLLFDLSQRLQRLPNSLPLRTEVARISQQYLDRLASSASASDAVRLESAAGLLRLAEQQGRPGWPNLGQADAARASYAKALAALESISGPAAQGLRAEVLISRSQLEAQTFSELEAAERSLQAAAPFVRSAAGSALRGDFLVALGSVRMSQGRYDEAIRLARAATAEQGMRDEYRRRIMQATALDVMADSTNYNDNNSGSIPLFRRSVDAWQAVVARWPGDLLAMRRLARSRYGLGHALLDEIPAEGEAVLAQAAVESRAISERDPSDAEANRMYMVIESGYAQALGVLGRTDEATRILSAQIERRRRHWSAAPHEARRLRDLAINIAMLADIEADAGRIDTACRRYDEVLSLFDRLRRSGQHIGLDNNNAVLLARESRARHCET